MNWKFRVAAAVLLVGAAAQLVQPDLSNPPVDPARRLWNDRKVNPRVAGLVRRACADCHSNHTEWPWYARLSPVSWFVAQHVANGRAKLNFDEWPSAAAADQLQEIYESVAKGKMPLASYALVHPEARLSPEERQILLAWADGKL